MSRHSILHSLRAPLAFVVLSAGASVLPMSPAAPTPRGWDWPLQPVPRVVHPFRPPSSPYGPGHRGVDLAGVLGEGVVAVAPGVVKFAGSVAGIGVVVVDHGTVSSTYQPIGASVSTGQRVAAGDRLGWLMLIGSHCLPEPCLHLGAKRDDTYLDPLDLLPTRPIRLKPVGGLRYGHGADLPPDGHERVRPAGEPAGRRCAAVHW